jgi:hypothetical protein
MVHNIHERQLAAPAAAAGALLDSLAGQNDRLWPRRQWPPMRFDRPLGVGATGGHGPIRYTVEEYVPGVRVRFRFLAPTGFHGYHEYEVLPDAGHGCWLRHSLVMTTGWPAWVSWPLFYRRLHDALIEDSLDTATRNLGLALPTPHRWSRRVRMLRSLARPLRSEARRLG